VSLINVFSLSLLHALKSATALLSLRLGFVSLLFRWDFLKDFSLTGMEGSLLEELCFLALLRVPLPSL
jgi:hypothetical protein